MSTLSGCFWTDDAPLPVAPSAPPPASADVVIIGSGYTGLAAARETALAGRSTLVSEPSRQDCAIDKVPTAHQNEPKTSQKCTA